MRQQGNSTEPQRLATIERVMFTGETFVHWLYTSVNEGKRKFHQIFPYNVEIPFFPYTLMILQQQPLADPKLAVSHMEEALMAFFHHLDILTLPWGTLITAHCSKWKVMMEPEELTIRRKGKKNQCSYVPVTSLQDILKQ